MIKIKKALLISSFLMAFSFIEQANAYGGLIFVNQGQGDNYQSKKNNNNTNSDSLNEDSLKRSRITELNSNSLSKKNEDVNNHLSTIRVTSSSFGRVPLWLAISQIVPQGYQTTFGKDINQNMNVGWDVGSTVQESLDNIASQTHLNYDVSGNNIVFTKGDSKAEQISGADNSKLNKIGGAGGGVSTGQDQAKITVHQENGHNEVYDKIDHTYGNKRIKGQKFPTTEHQLPSKPFSPSDGGEGVYFAPSKSNLASVIESWAARSGWSVVNDTDDIYYPLMASASFKGTFTESVASIVNSFKDASPYPRVTFYPNHVMRIYTSESSEN